MKINRSLPRPGLRMPTKLISNTFSDKPLRVDARRHIQSGVFSGGGLARARQLESQLDLTVMVALVPEHVLEQKNRVIVVKVHLAAERE